MAIKSVMEETIDYIPKYAGNRMQKDPLWVKIYPLTRAEADRYRDMITLEDQGGGFRQGRVKSNVRKVQRRQFTDNVREVHNFIHWKTNEEITGVEDFYEKAPDDLIEEIFDAMLNASILGEDEVKNSDSQSGSSNPGEGETGTAETATKKVK